MERPRFLARWILAMVAVVALAACGSTTDDGGGGGGGGGTAAVAPPHLRSLADRARETVNLAVVDGDAVVYIYKEEGTLAVKMSAQLGSRRPLHCTALGKAYLAALSAAELEVRLGGLELTRFTAATITDPAALGAELDRGRHLPAARPPLTRHHLPRSRSTSCSAAR